MTKKLWGSAFDKPPSEAVISFCAGRDVTSIQPADKKLIPYDIALNIAHCKMLEKQEILTTQESKQILTELNEIQELYEKNEFKLDPNKEDIHSNIESWLTEKLGIEIAGKLHTARSRNDQVATDMRMYLRDQIKGFLEILTNLEEELANRAEEYKANVMPGFTHHQHAMLTTFGHTLHAFLQMVKRDKLRFRNWLKLHNKCPLGGTASYGTTFNIDREFTAKELGFDAPEPNSMDPIMNRWEAEADLAYAVTILMNHLSELAQWLILFSTPQFNMVKLADEYSTGSSVMPQKKNPDPLEVIKGKAGMVSGMLQSLISTGKANFLGYNRDSQWTKYIIMDLVDECIDAPNLITGVLSTMQVNTSVMDEWAHKGFIGATTLMEQIAINFNLPIRIAKVIIEKSVKNSTNLDKIEHEVLISVLKSMDIEINISKDEVDKWQDPQEIIKLTKSYGGPGNF